jgi:2-dehydro-3-deoxygalactonokinase
MQGAANVSAVPSLIALDWGTSSLRALLLDENGTVLDARAEPWGILRVPNGDFAAAFDAISAEWRERNPALKAVAAGMIGSAQGWVQAPYCAAPAGVAELSAALTTVSGASLYIVPGIAQYGEHPDVMRGEETQIVGVLARHPELAAQSLMVLPGTHSKWASVTDDKVRTFTTFMTGELFAVLGEHSILGRFAREADHEADPVEKEQAFALGVAAAQRSEHGVASMLFTARSLILTKRLAAEVSLDYLSGLLIGDELRWGITNGARPDALVGDAALCARYVAALRIFGVCDVQVIDDAAQAGLWSIACRAGLTASVE